MYGHLPQGVAEATGVINKLTQLIFPVWHWQPLPPTANGNVFFHPVALSSDGSLRAGCEVSLPFSDNERLNILFAEVGFEVSQNSLPPAVFNKFRKRTDPFCGSLGSFPSSCRDGYVIPALLVSPAQVQRIVESASEVLACAERHLTHFSTRKQKGFGPLKRFRAVCGRRRGLQA